MRVRLQLADHLPPWWYLGFSIPQAMVPLFGPRGTIWIVALEQPHNLGPVGYLSFYMAIAIGVLLLFRFRERVPSEREGRSFLLLGCSAVSLGVLFFSSASVLILGSYGYWVGLVAAGLGLAPLILGWGSLFKALDPGSMRISICASFVFAVVLYAAINVVGGAAPLAAAALMLALPWLSLAALLTGKRTVDSPRPPLPLKGVSRSPMRPGILGGISLYGVVFGFMTALTATQGAWGPDNVVLIQSVLVGAVALSMLAGALFSKDYGPGLMYRPVLPLVVIGCLLLPILGADTAYFASSIVAAAIGYFRTFWVTLSSDMARASRASVVDTLGRAMIADYGGVAIGIFLNGALASGLSFSSSQLTILSSAVVVLLILASMSLLNERILDHVWDSAPASSVGSAEVSIEGRCARISELHELTPRQREVLVLLARGRNREYIQNTLVLSKYTVRTHIQRIYEKLGIHSHQELIDLVEACEPKTEQAAVARGASSGS